jgi:hypothetical protein
MRLRRLTILLVATMVAACLIVPATAFARSTTGELASWSPEGGVAAETMTTLMVGCSDEAKRAFYAVSGKTVFVNTNHHAKRVGRNTLFRSIAKWAASGDCPDLHMHWKWKTRADGTRYRYVTRLEAANRPD